MNYSIAITSAGNDPAALENLYRQAVKASQAAEFGQAINESYTAQPDNLLYSAWHYRLAEGARPGRQIDWKSAVILGVANGVLFGLLAQITGPGTLFAGTLPYLFLIGSPTTALAIIAYLYTTQGEGKNLRLAGLLAGVLTAALVYALVLTPGLANLRDQAATQAVLHLGLLSLAAIGVYLAGLQPRPGVDTDAQRFAFLLKTLEVLTVSGLALIAGGIFFGVSMGLFATLNVRIPEELVIFTGAGGVGMIPVLAVAWIYDPRLTPAEQDFQQGLSRILALLVRALVAPSLLVGLVYVLLIPFNFMAPFENRDILIASNAMLFAVMALLLGAVPLKADELSERAQKLLKTGLLIIAGLAVIVSLYALSAILYRTFIGGLTINRFVTIGWNVINTLLLGGMLYLQARAQSGAGRHADWVEAVRHVYSRGAAAYIVWALVVLVVSPLLGRF